MSDSPDSSAEGIESTEGTESTASPENTEDTANIANTESTASAPDAADSVEPDTGDAVEPAADSATSTPAPIPVSHTTDLMRGIRQGAALSATAFACAAFLVHRYMEPAIPPPGKGGMVLLISQCLIGFVAWRIGRSRWEPTSRLMICVLTGTLGIGAVGALISWTFFSIRGSRTITGGLAACAVASLTPLDGGLDEALDSMRRSVHALSDDGEELATSLNLLGSRCGIDSVSVDCSTEAEPPAVVARCVVAVVREALTNAARPGGARSARVAVTDYPAFWQVTVDNDGVVPVEDEPVVDGHEGAGLGLRSMTERVEALGGRVQITPRPRFTVFATIPKNGQGKEGAL